MKDKPFVIEYRNNPHSDRSTITELFPDHWEKFKSYATERARNQALKNYKSKFGFLEFRPRFLTPDAVEEPYMDPNPFTFCQHGERPENCDICNSATAQME